MKNEEAICRLKSVVRIHNIFFKKCKKEIITKKEIEAIDIVLNYIEELEKENKILRKTICENAKSVLDIEKPYKDLLEKIKDKIEILERLKKNFPNNEELKIKATVYKELLEE